MFVGECLFVLPQHDKCESSDDGDDRYNVVFDDSDDTDV